MRFIVSRRSILNGPYELVPFSPPCEGAIHERDGFYVIEIETLDDLLALAGREGELIVARNDARNSIAQARIEIYDADRE